MKWRTKSLCLYKPLVIGITFSYFQYVYMEFGESFTFILINPLECSVNSVYLAFSRLKNLTFLQNITFSVVWTVALESSSLPMYRKLSKHRHSATFQRCVTSHKTEDFIHITAETSNKAFILMFCVIS